VSIDGLEETESDPEEDGENVEIPGEVAIQERASDGTSAENHDFSGMSVFCGETEGSRVFVVNFVNVFIQRSTVQCLVG
jgi:hypothetical protein